MKLNLTEDVQHTIPSALGITEEFIETIARPWMEDTFHPKNAEEEKERLITALARGVEKCETIEQVVYLTYIMARKAALIDGR